MARKKKPAAKTVNEEQSRLVPADVPQVTNYDGGLDVEDTITVPPEFMEKHAKLEARLAAAEDLIQSQSDLLDAWSHRKNRNRPMDAVLACRNAWMKTINE